MQKNEYVEFRKVRDFGDVINVTFVFLRQNFVVLGKSLLLIAGPAALIGGLSSMGMWDTALNLENAESFADELGAGIFGLSYLIFILLSLVSTVLSVTVVNGFMALYKERGPDQITLEDIWHVVKERFGVMLSTTLFSALLYFGSALVIAVSFLFSFFGSSTVSTILAGLSLFIGSIVWIVALFYFIVIISLLFPVRMHESTGNLEAFQRCRYLIRNNYGNSFAVLMVSGILMTILGLLFSAPSYILTFMGGLHAIWDGEVSWVKYPLTIVSVMASLGSSLLYAIPSVAMGLQYFSLVEKKEKTGLMHRIENLNKEDDDLF